MTSYVSEELTHLDGIRIVSALEAGSDLAASTFRLISGLSVDARPSRCVERPRCCGEVGGQFGDLSGGEFYGEGRA